MSQESDVYYTTSMHDVQNQFIPDEINLFYFKTWIITHNNNVEQNIHVSTFDILSVKNPHKKARLASIFSQLSQNVISCNSSIWSYFSFKAASTLLQTINEPVCENLYFNDFMEVVFVHNAHLKTKGAMEGLWT